MNKPFERIQDHRSVIRDIDQMRENLDELEDAVRTLEWQALGGRGGVRPDRLDRVCEAVENSMPYIREDIRELNSGTAEKQDP
jgi:hypothetical protein